MVVCTYEVALRVWRWRGCESALEATPAYPALPPISADATKDVNPRGAAGSTKQRSWRQFVVLGVRAI